MTAWLLVTALAQDLADWEKPTAKPEATDLPEPEGPVISCCGFDRGAWREMLQPALTDVRACFGEEPEEALRVATSLTIDGETGSVRAAIRTEDERLRTCLTSALEAATWPREPPGCDLTINWPVVVVPPPRPEER